MSKFLPFIAAECRPWPTKERMGEILQGTGLRVDVRRYSVCIEGSSHVSFEQYGGDLGDPSIEAFADSEADVLNDMEKISGALGRAGVIHSFTIYDENEKAIAHFHHELPRDSMA